MDGGREWTVGVGEDRVGVNNGEKGRTTVTEQQLKKKKALASVVQWIEPRLQTSCWFDSQSWHRPVLQARSPVWGMQEANIH